MFWGLKKIIVVLSGVVIMSSGLAAEKKELMLRGGMSKLCPSNVAPGGSAKSEAIFSPSAVSVIVAVGGELIGSVIDAVAKELTEADPLTLKSTFPVFELLVYDDINRTSSLAPTTRCLWIAVAEELTIPAINAEGNPKAGLAKQSAITDEDLTGLSVADKSEFQSRTGMISGKPLSYYFEAEVKASTDGRAWTLMPVKAHYPKFLEESSWYQKDVHDFGLLVEFLTPEATKAFSTFYFSQDSVREGRMTAESLSGNLQLSTFPSLSGSQTLKVGPYFPANVRVMLTETKNPTKLSSIIGKVVKEQKSNIVDGIQNMASTSFSAKARQVVRDSAVAAAIELNEKYVTAYGLAYAAYKKYNDLKNDPSSSPADVTNAYNALMPLINKAQVAEDAVREAYSGAGLNFKPQDAIPVS